MTTTKTLPDFTKGSIPKQLVSFAAPLFLSSLLQIVYNMVDMVIVGQKLGQVGLSAVSIGGDLSHFMTFLAMGFSNAGQIIISQYVGAGRRDKVGKIISTLFLALLGTAVCFSSISLAFREPLLDLMNTPAEAFFGALEYSTVCMFGLIFIYGYNAASAVLRGLGDSVHPFLFISFAAVLNVILDMLLVFVIPMGCMGAALATVISQGISFLLSASFLLRRQRDLGIQLGRGWKDWFDRDIFSGLCKLGLPMAIKSAAIQFSKLSVNAWINSYGVVVSAVTGIASKINSVSYLVSNAANTAGSTMVGQNVGAQQFSRVPKILAVITFITAGGAAVMSAVLLLYPQWIFSLFTRDAAVLSVAMEYLPAAVLVFFGSALRAPMNALIDGSGNHRINFLTAILDGIIMRLGLAYLLGIVLDMGYLGFWLGDGLAGFTPVVIGTAYGLSGKWKRRIVK